GEVLLRRWRRGEALLFRRRCGGVARGHGSSRRPQVDRSLAPPQCGSRRSLAPRRPTPAPTKGDGRSGLRVAVWRWLARHLVERHRRPRPAPSPPRATARWYRSRTLCDTPPALGQAPAGDRPRAALAPARVARSHLRTGGAIRARGWSST